MNLLTGRRVNTYETTKAHSNQCICDGRFVRAGIIPEITYPDCILNGLVWWQHLLNNVVLNGLVIILEQNTIPSINFTNLRIFYSSTILFGFLVTIYTRPKLVPISVSFTRDWDIAYNVAIQWPNSSIIPVHFTLQRMYFFKSPYIKISTIIDIRFYMGLPTTSAIYQTRAVSDS